MLYLSGPLHADSEDSVFALSRECDFQLDSVRADGEGVPGVQVGPAVEDGLSGPEDLGVGVHHRLDDVAVDFAWTLKKREMNEVKLFSELHYSLFWTKVCKKYLTDAVKFFVLFQKPT